MFSYWREFQQCNSTILWTFTFYRLKCSLQWKFKKYEIASGVFVYYKLAYCSYSSIFLHFIQKRISVRSRMQSILFKNNSIVRQGEKICVNRKCFDGSNSSKAKLWQLNSSYKLEEKQKNKILLLILKVE